MNQTLIKDINIWTMDERDSRFFGWVLLENGKIASMGEGEPPAMPVQIDGDVVYGEGGVLTPGLIDIHSHIGLYEDALALRVRTATRTPIRRRRTCVHWTASTRSTAASARHLRPV